MSSKILTLLKKNKKSVYFVASLAGLFVLLNYILLPLYVYHGGTLGVPDVVGQQVDDAKKVLSGSGLEPVVTDTRPDPKQPAGVVVMQNPRADATVKYGRRVYLTVSGGEVSVMVPSLRGRSLRDARFSLERSGLVLGEVAYDTSALYPENTVMAQAPQVSTSVPKGTSVAVTVSRGSILPECAVPDLMGVMLTEARRLVERAGLKTGKITYQPSSDLLPNTVVDQFPRSGEIVPKGQPVDLFVTKAGRPVEEIPTPHR